MYLFSGALKDAAALSDKNKIIYFFIIIVTNYRLV